MLRTIPIVCPIGAGTLIPDSLISSRDISISRISNITGNGTLLLDATIANSSSVGINSWWNIVIAIYKPGSNIVMKNAINLIAFSKFANWYFRFLSSAVDKKSIRTPGTASA